MEICFTTKRYEARGLTGGCIIEVAYTLPLGKYEALTQRLPRTIVASG